VAIRAPVLALATAGVFAGGGGAFWPVCIQPPAGRTFFSSEDAVLGECNVNFGVKLVNFGGGGGGLTPGDPPGGRPWGTLGNELAEAGGGPHGPIRGGGALMEAADAATAAADGAPGTANPMRCISVAKSAWDMTPGIIPGIVVGMPNMQDAVPASC